MNKRRISDSDLTCQVTDFHNIDTMGKIQPAYARGHGLVAHDLSENGEDLDLDLLRGIDHEATGSNSDLHITDTRHGLKGRQIVSHGFPPFGKGRDRESHGESHGNDRQKSYGAHVHDVTGMNLKK